MNNLASNGGLRIVLRLEGLVELTLAAVLYAHLSASGPIFAIAFFAPDVAFAGYLINARAGAIAAADRAKRNPPGEAIFRRATKTEAR